jgi:ankyrin repeat protein
MKFKLSFFVLLLLLSSPIFGQSVQEAIDRSDTTLAIQLIKKGTSVNEIDAQGITPLMHACRWTDPIWVSFLLRHGATPDNPRSPKGRTSLMIACAYYGGLSVCKMLVEAGANVNIKANDNVTALMLAAQNGKVDVVQYLLSKGADAKQKDAKGKTALDYINAQTDFEYITKAVKDCKIDKPETITLLEKSMK